MVRSIKIIRDSQMCVWSPFPASLVHDIGSEEVFGSRRQHLSTVRVLLGKVVEDHHLSSSGRERGRFLVFRALSVEPGLIIKDGASSAVTGAVSIEINVDREKGEPPLFAQAHSFVAVDVLEALTLHIFAPTEPLIEADQLPLLVPLPAVRHPVAFGEKLLHSLIKNGCQRLIVGQHPRVSPSGSSIFRR